MFDLPTFFFLLSFVFIIVVVSVMNGGTVILQSFTSVLSKIVISGFIVILLVSRLLQWGFFEFLHHQAEPIDQNYAYNAISDIGNNPDDADKYVSQLNNFLDGLTLLNQQGY